MQEYKMTFEGKELTYGALVENSNFNDREWQAIHTHVAAKSEPALTMSIFDCEELDVLKPHAIDLIGRLVCLEERYEALLAMLPQESFSIAGTHPKWVTGAVAENTYNKGATQDDVTDMIRNSIHQDGYEGIVNDLCNYFGLDFDDINQVV